MKRSTEEIIIQRNIAAIERERRKMRRMDGARSDEQEDVSSDTFYLPHSENMRRQILRKLEAYREQLVRARRAFRTGCHYYHQPNLSGYR